MLLKAFTEICGIVKSDHFCYLLYLHVPRGKKLYRPIHSCLFERRVGRLVKSCFEYPAEIGLMKMHHLRQRGNAELWIGVMPSNERKSLIRY